MYEDDQEANMSFKRRGLYQLFTKGKYSKLRQWNKASTQSAYLHLQFFLEQINWVYKVNHEYLAFPNRHKDRQKDIWDT